MNLNKIIENLKTTSIFGNTDIEISDIIYDSRKVKKDCIFVCLKGVNSNGHDFIPQAIELGAKAVVVEENMPIAGVTVIKVENTRKALAHMSANFFKNPSKELKTIAITGTKGKTTTSFMIKSILESSGFKAGVIGTIGVILGKEITALNNTTPESYDVQKYFRKMVDEGCKYAIIEASSIGLARNRLDNIVFNIGIFTNISSDHIGKDEHKDYKEYIEAKSLLFKKCHVGIINKDDENYREIIKNHTCQIKTFGIIKDSDYNANSIELINENGYIGTSFKLTGNLNIEKISISIPGEFNVYNSLAACATCDLLGISSENIISGIKSTTVKGRFEPVIKNSKYSLFIDYAHNAVSMENILKTLKKYSPKRIVTLFGAGGNRPKIRRYEMGEVCGKFSDFSVITSDNPRFEEPLEIIKDIESGIKKTKGKYTIIPDRKKAIKFCIENALEGDVIILAGKGHEDYQEIKGIKYPFDEREVIKDILKEINFKN